MRLFTAALATMAFFGARADAFTVKTTENPVQCNEFTVEWSGGTPPFNFVIIPVSTVHTAPKAAPVPVRNATISYSKARIQNITFDADQTAAQKGSFTLLQPAGLDFIGVMSDATGWGAGGQTKVMTVGSSSQQSCLEAEVKADFWFWNTPEDNPPQCSNMLVEWEPNATYPVQLFGVVPGGSTWEISVETDKNKPREKNWTVNLAHGTRFILLMADAGPYGTGGSTMPLTVQYSDDKSCITPDSPKSTAGSSATSKPSVAPGVYDGPSKPPIGAIVGGVVGGVVAIALAGILLFYCRRKKRNNHEMSEQNRRGLLGFSNSTSNGKQRGSWEIDAVELSPGDAQREAAHDSRADETHSVEPFPYSPATPTMTTRDSYYSEPNTEGGSSTGGLVVPAAAARRSRKEVPVGLALSAGAPSTIGASSARTSRQMSGDSGPSAQGPSHVSELNAVETATPGQVLVDRDELIAMLDPPPLYNQFEETPGPSSHSKG